jgi:hypothetical protein
MADIADFSSATIGQEAYVYSGNALEGWDYSFVTSLDWFDDDDEVVVLTRSRWKLVAEDVVTIYPNVMLCTQCHGDGEREGADCDRCDGAGSDPLEGSRTYSAVGGES